MGTNYYWNRNPACPCCGRNDEPIHIGKSSYGWCFGLHAVDFGSSGLKISSLIDWVREWRKCPDGEIINEDGGRLTVHEMLSVITRNGWKKRERSMSDEELRRNYAFYAPNGLLRHKVLEGWTQCIAHGKGNWDIIVGEFS